MLARFDISYTCIICHIEQLGTSRRQTKPALQLVIRISYRKMDKKIRGGGVKGMCSLGVYPLKPEMFWFLDTLRSFLGYFCAFQNHDELTLVLIRWFGVIHHTWWKWSWNPLTNCCSWIEILNRKYIIAVVFNSELQSPYIFLILSFNAVFFEKLTSLPGERGLDFSKESISPLAFC